MSAAVDSLVLLRTMPNYPGPAVWASWGQGMNCAFKTIKDMRFSSDGDFESLVVDVSREEFIAKSHDPSASLDSPPLFPNSVVEALQRAAPHKA